MNFLEENNMHTFKTTLIQENENVLAYLDNEIIPAVAGTDIRINKAWYKITDVILYCDTLENSYSLTESIFVEEEQK